MSDNTFPVKPLQTYWDDLLAGVASPADWDSQRPEMAARFHALLRADAAPEIPVDLDIRIEEEWDTGEFTVRYISYQVEEDERAAAYIAIPASPPPASGWPGVICLQGTTNWGAQRTLGLAPHPDDPHAGKSMAGLTDARTLVRHGYVTISPEHFCCASRLPAAGPFDTGDFYRRHPDWSAAGKATYENGIALSILASLPQVDADRLGCTGHSLGGHGTLWLAAVDPRIRCAVPSCPGGSFRQNPEPLHWSRDYWYVYFPQLRQQMLDGETIRCDHHEWFALIAPRPCMELFALNDGDLRMNQHRMAMHALIGELYEILGHGECHVSLTFGDGHAVPDLSRVALVSWMDRWLKYGGDPLGNWDARPTPRPGLPETS